MPTTPTVRVGQFAAQVAAEVRAVMGRKMIKQSHLAQALGENDMWLSRRLRGERSFDLDDLQRIAAILGCSPSDFVPVTTATAPSEGAANGVTAP